MKRLAFQYGDLIYGDRRAAFEGVNLGDIDFNDFLGNISISQGAGAGTGESGGLKGKVGAVIGGGLGGAIGSIFAPGAGSGLGAAAGSWVGKMFDPGGKFGKDVEKRAGVRDSDGWGAEVVFPNNERSVVAPWGTNGQFYEVGDWGKYKGSDGVDYTGFKSYILDSKGNRLKEVALATRYAKANPDGTITSQSNYAPWDNSDFSFMYLNAPNGSGGQTVTKLGTGTEPPNFTPFEGFLLKSEFMALLKNGGNNNAVQGGQGGPQGTNDPLNGWTPEMGEKWAENPDKTENNPENATPNQPTPEKESNTNWLWIALAVIILIVILK